jgi:hypothetical protein
VQSCLGRLIAIYNLEPLRERYDGYNEWTASEEDSAAYVLADRAKE